MRTALFSMFVFIVLPTFLPITAIHGADPYDKNDESWITISGRSVAPMADSFTLDYGEGTIKVEMDDSDWVHEGYQIVEGHQVTVSGRVDQNLYARTSIEASSVYDQDLNQYFFASANDDEPFWNEYPATPIVVGRTTVRGTVSSVNPFQRQFTIKSGGETLTIDTWTLNYNPLDDVGYQKIQVGDRVFIGGQMTRDFMANRKLQADRVITLTDASKRMQKMTKGAKKDESGTTKRVPLVAPARTVQWAIRTRSQHAHRCPSRGSHSTVA